MTQEELAGLVGASRERVNKALALFVRLGWLEVTGRSHYRILDREALELRARPVARSAPARPSTSAWARDVRAEERAGARQRVGGVVGAVRRAVGVVHEAVVGVGVDDDLAVGPVAPRGPQRLDVGRRASTGPRRRRSRASGTTSAAVSSGSRWLGPRQSSGTPDHPVERHRAVERPVAAALSVYMPPMQKPRIATSLDVVVDDEEVGGDVEVAELDVVVELLDPRHARRRHRAASRRRTCANGSAHAHREAVRGEPAAEIVEERHGSP